MTPPDSIRSRNAPWSIEATIPAAVDPVTDPAPLPVVPPERILGPGDWENWMQSRGVRRIQNHSLLINNAKQLARRLLALTAEKVLDNFQALEDATPEERTRLWPLVLQTLTDEGIPFPEERAASYEDFLEWTRELGTLFPERVRSLRALLSLMNRRGDMRRLGEERPIAVVFASSSDHNSATTVRCGFPLLDTLESEGSFDVVYFEIAEEDEVEARMRELTAACGRRVHTLIFEGHGVSSALAWDGEDPTAGSGFGEDDWLDTGDISSGEMDFLRNMLEPDGQIFYMSCSGGAGGESAPNLVNRTADRFRGIDVLGLPEPGNLVALRIEGDSHRLQLALTGGAPYFSRYEPEDPGLIVIPRDLQVTSNSAT